MCELELFSYDMLAIAWCVIGCSIAVGIGAYNEGKRQGKNKK